MKNIILLSGLLSVALLTTQCADDNFNDYYKDPSKVNTIQIDRTMAGGIFKNTTDFWEPGYGRYYSLESTWIGTFSQTLGGKSASAEMYNPSFSTVAYWNSFYTALGHFRLMEQMYDGLQEAEQKSNECFMLASKIYLYDFLSLLVSIYGDVPFSKAGYLPVNNDITTSFAAYDEDETLFENILDGLAAINTRFGEDDFLETAGKTNFSTQDILLRGDLAKWRMYANGIRLRLANRIATNPNALQAKGRSILKEILENPQANPLPETNEQNIIIKNYRNNFMDYTPGYGLHENSGWRADANQALIDRMRTDPRLRLLYQKTDTASYKESDPENRKYNPEKGVYLGRDYKDEAELHTQAESQFYRENGGTGISRIVQYGFFWDNKKFDAFLYTASETWFTRAEAIARGDAKATDETAESCFKKAVQLSLSYYFYCYENMEPNGGGNPPDGYKNVPSPSDDEKAAFANERWAAIGTDYVNETDAIITQKWVHFSIFSSREQWSDIRRTGFPSGLYYPKGSGTIPVVPSRWKYPDSERIYNSYNYEPLRAKDTYETPLFWIKTNWSDNEYSGKQY